MRSLFRDIAQYGLTPSKAFYRFGLSGGPKVLANSIPKSGTNLLLRALYLTPELYRAIHKTLLSDNLETSIKKLKAAKPNQVIAGHLYYSNELTNLIGELDIKNLLIVRDPRDVVVSKCHYATYKDRSHYLSKYYNTLPSDDARISMTISGDDNYRSATGLRFYGMNFILDQYIGWYDEPDCLIIRFEDLIGGKGGGGLSAQINALRNVYEHIGLDLPDSKLKYIADNLFNTDSKTFNKGLIGSWREVFSDEHMSLFKEKCGQALVKMGYERDFDW